MDPFNREALWLPNNTLTPTAYSIPYSTSSPLYAHISTLNNLRSLAQNQSRNYTTSLSQIIYSDAHSIVFQKGDSIFTTFTIVNNLGSLAANHTLTIHDTGLPAGLELLDAMTCQATKVNDKGGLSMEVSNGEPVVSLIHLVLTHKRSGILPNNIRFYIPMIPSVVTRYATRNQGLRHILWELSRLA